MCSAKEQPHLLSKSKEFHVDQCVKYENKEETSLWECQANVMDDKNWHGNMQPVKPAVCDDKKCQSTKFLQKIQYMMARTVNLPDAIR